MSQDITGNHDRKMQGKIQWHLNKTSSKTSSLIYLHPMHANMHVDMWQRAPLTDARFLPSLRTHRQTPEWQTLTDE
jgi:hypothetical protein